MAELTARSRNALPAKEFAGPDRSYPVPDAEHAANAKARAKQQLDKGHIDRAEYDRIVRKADAVLAHHGLRRDPEHMKAYLDNKHAGHKAAVERQSKLYRDMDGDGE